MVEPFYAVKCNPDPVIVRLLAALGCGFDCATKGEIDLVLNGLGEDLSFAARKLTDKIVYANPQKMKSHIEFAA
jgi:ornithine decarboxylase